jgi:hypothetical protein
MVSTAKHKYKAKEKFVDCCFRLQLYSAEIRQTEPFSFSKQNFITYVTTKSKKNSGFFFQIAEFYGEIGGQTSPPRPGNSGKG